MVKFRDPVRRINTEILAALTLESTKIYPLQGGVGQRWTNEIDPRLSKGSAVTPVGDTVTFYEHIATVRDSVRRVFYVAFRETVDAQLARTRHDLKKYPEWLMKDPRKQSERQIFIYLVKKHPSTVAVMRSHEDWLSHINDRSVFDAIAHFLAKNSVISDEVYKNLLAS